jgi:uncharacterized protein YeaO (DUF488 family)
MAIRFVRLGMARLPSEGLRVGVVRRVPRGVPKEQYAARNYFDVWLPMLAPTAPLVSWAQASPLTPERWEDYARRYRREMRQPDLQRLLSLLAALSLTADFSLGCYCQDEERCHRALLRELLSAHGALLVERNPSSNR